jgi:hypothetical protein
MRWSIVNPKTRERRTVEPDEWFPISGRLLSGVWELDDGSLLMVTSDEDTDANAKPTVRVAYVDPRRTAAIIPTASRRGG